MKLVVCFNIVWGLYSTMGAVISSFTGQFGFGPSDNTLFSISFALVGMVGSFVTGRYLDKTKQFRKAHTRLSFLLAAMIPICYLALLTRINWFAAIFMAVLGFATVPFLPVSFEYGAELTFPLGQALMGGILFGTSQIFATILLLIVQQLIEISVLLFFAFLFFLMTVNFLVSPSIE